MSARDRIRRALIAAGLSDRPDLYDSNIHSWRCEYPDQWGRCTCLDDLVDDLVTQTRSLEAQLAKQRRWIAKLFDDRRKTRAEVTRLHEQFTALAVELEARAEECVAVGEGPAWDAANGAATRIRRILAGTQ